MSNENELIEVIKNIVATMARENGSDWCSDTINKLSSIQHSLTKDGQLAIKFGEFMRQKGNLYTGNMYRSATDLYIMFKNGEVKL